MMAIFKSLQNRLEELRARFNARRNRKRHPRLARMYDRESDPEERFLIAQQMMMFDKNILRRSASGAKLPDPIVWDYHIPTGRLGWKMAKSRRADREKDASEIRQRLHVGRR